MDSFHGRENIKQHLESPSFQTFDGLLVQCIFRRTKSIHFTGMFENDTLVDLGINSWQMDLGRWNYSEHCHIFREHAGNFVDAWRECPKATWLLWALKLTTYDLVWHLYDYLKKRYPYGICDDIENDITRIQNGEAMDVWAYMRSYGEGYSTSQYLEGFLAEVISGKSPAVCMNQLSMAYGYSEEINGILTEDIEEECAMEIRRVVGFRKAIK